MDNEGSRFALYGGGSPFINAGSSIPRTDYTQVMSQQFGGIAGDLGRIADLVQQLLHLVDNNGNPAFNFSGIAAAATPMQAYIARSINDKVVSSGVGAAKREAINSIGTYISTGAEELLRRLDVTVTPEQKSMLANFSSQAAQFGSMFVPGLLSNDIIAAGQTSARYGRPIYVNNLDDETYRRATMETLLGDPEKLSARAVADFERVKAGISDKAGLFVDNKKTFGLSFDETMNLDMMLRKGGAYSEADTKYGKFVTDYADSRQRAKKRVDSSAAAVAAAERARDEEVNRELAAYKEKYGEDANYTEIYDKVNRGKYGHAVETAKFAQRDANNDLKMADNAYQNANKAYEDAVAPIRREAARLQQAFKDLYGSTEAAQKALDQMSDGQWTGKDGAVRDRLYEFSTMIKTLGLKSGQGTNEVMAVFNNAMQRNAAAMGLTATEASLGYGTQSASLMAEKALDSVSRMIYNGGIRGDAQSRRAEDVEARRVEMASSSNASAFAKEIMASGMDKEHAQTLLRALSTGDRSSMDAALETYASYTGVSTSDILTKLSDPEYGKMLDAMLTSEQRQQAADIADAGSRGEFLELEKQNAWDYYSGMEKYGLRLGDDKKPSKLMAEALGDGFLNDKFNEIYSDSISRGLSETDAYNAALSAVRSIDPEKVAAAEMSANESFIEAVADLRKDEGRAADSRKAQYEYLDSVSGLLTDEQRSQLSGMDRKLDMSQDFIDSLPEEVRSRMYSVAKTAANHGAAARSKMAIADLAMERGWSGTQAAFIAQNYDAFKDNGYQIDEEAYNQWKEENAASVAAIEDEGAKDMGATNILSQFADAISGGQETVDKFFEHLKEGTDNMKKSFGWLGTIIEDFGNSVSDAKKDIDAAQ